MSIPDECVWYNQCIRGQYEPVRCPRKIVQGPGGVQAWSTQMFDIETNECIDKRKV